MGWIPVIVAGVKWETPPQPLFPGAVGIAGCLQKKVGEYQPPKRDRDKDLCLPTTSPERGTHGSRLGLRSLSGGRGVFLAGGDTAAPEGLFSRRHGLEPGLTKAMVPCSWLEILWDACGGS